MNDLVTELVELVYALHHGAGRDEITVRVDRAIVLLEQATDAVFAVQGPSLEAVV